MKINKHDFTKLKILLEKGTITKSAFKNQDIVDGLKQNGSVKDGKKTPKLRYIELLKPENIFLFLQQNNYNINSLEDIDSYIKDMFNSSVSRDTIQKHTSNTKSKTSKSLDGLYISSLQDIDIKIDDEVVTIIPQNGMGYFLFYTQEVELFEDTVIVGIENYQVVWFAKKYKEFFKDKKVLFVYINTIFLKWIEDKENEYIHFGDYDLAGINIYLNKVIPRLKKVKKHSIFIPKDIEKLIKEHGDFKLFKKQLRYEDITASQDNIAKLISTIKYYKKGLEQEGLYLF
ncbi:MAG: hypothetical protein ABGW74_03295 [Campylobacterales bacterium]